MKYFLLLFTVLLVAACQNKNRPTWVADKNPTEDSIIIPGNTDLTRKLKTIKIQQESFVKKIPASGIVKAIPNNYAEIASPFSGRITRSFVSLGQKVDIGSPVFEISSPSFFEAGKAYYQSKQEMQLADKNLKRQQDLFSNGVGTQKDLDEAEVTFELTKRDFENSIASLKVYQVNPEELILGQPLIIRSPIRGEVVDNNIVIGQYLNEDAEPVAIVAELSKVWVIGQLKEKDINSVHKSDEVEIRLSGMPDVSIKGEIFHVGEILDEATRSVQIYVLCENSDRVMKPGMFVTTHFSESTDNVILIPSTSLYQMEETSFVFVYLGNDKFVKRHVEVNGTDGDRVIIKAGLKPGEEIVIEGGSLLAGFKNKNMRVIILFALRRWRIMIVLFSLIAIFGYTSWKQLSIEAYPDIADVTVQVITQVPGLAAEEIEQQITIPLERELNGLPGLNTMRSKNTFGLSAIILVFNDGVDDYWARQRVQERLSDVELPYDAMPGLNPLTSPTGEIYRYIIESKSHDLRELTELNKWVIIPRLKQVTGVADVSNFGGITTQFQIEIDPLKLEQYNLSLSDVTDMIEKNNSNAGGSLLQRGDLSYVVRGIGLVKDLNDLGDVVVKTENGIPIYVKDLGKLKYGNLERKGVLGFTDHYTGLSRKC